MNDSNHTNRPIKMDYAQFARFIIVGVINTLVTLVVIFVCKSLLGVNLWVSNALGYVAGVINSFVWNRAWVFRSQGRVYRQAVSFLIGFLICYCIQFAVTWSLTELTSLHTLLLETPWFTFSGYGIATLVGMCAYTLANFIYNRTVTFKGDSSSLYGVYNTLLTAADSIFSLIGRCRQNYTGENKLLKKAAGHINQRSELERIAAQSGLDSRPTAWVHCASLGEYAIVRPIIKELKEHREMRVVLTMFSASGYEPLRQGECVADELLYMPLDSKRNVNKFLDAIQPRLAIFAVSEYWPGYLRELRVRHIPTYLVSAKLNRSNPFRDKIVGSLYRDCLDSYTHIFAIDSDTEAEFLALGADSVSVEGDPLFDNAVSKTGNDWSDPIIEKFIADNRERVFVAGSIHDTKDAAIVTDLANAHPEIKHILVPHEIDSASIKEITDRLHVPYLIYSHIPDGENNPKEANVLIVDKVGILALVYRYATASYVGGGFTRLLHSVIEPLVYGIPVTFGPQIKRKVTPEQIISLGLGKIVRNSADLNEYISSLLENPDRLATIRENAKRYINRNCGATRRIADKILENEA